MKFAPTEARARLYRRLLTETLLVRSQTPSGERGHSFVYAAAHAVVRDRVDDEEMFREVCAFQDHMRTDLSLRGPASIIPENGSPAAVTGAVEQLWRTGAFTTILFEGYIADSRREHAAAHEALDAAFTARGATVLRPDPGTADRWNSKPRFTAFMRSLYGEHATPPGTSIASPSIAESVPLVIAAVRRFAAFSGKAIVKVPGLGGLGNLIVDAGDHDADARVTEFLSRASQAWPVLVESWYPWRHTLGCTFFAAEDGTVIPLEVCAQSVANATGGFLGGTSITGLSGADRAELQRLIAPFAARVTAEGMRGFFGVDVILSDPRPAHDECRLPDCDLAVRFVESNMRVNGQNQDRLFAAQVADCHGRDMDDIDHLKVAVLVAGATSRAASVAQVNGALDGLSRPFSRAFTPGELSHLVIECYGESRASRNDFVLFVGENVAHTAYADAAGRLRARGWLKD